MTLSSLDANKIHTLTTNMVDHDTIRLKVRDNLISTIPSWLNNFPKIIELDICCNNVSTIAQLQFLKKLNLSENNLTHISLDMPELEYLTLTGNQLTTLDLSKLTKLKSLDIAFNQLTTLDLTKLPSSLKVLRCGNNLLSSIPALDKFIHLVLLSIEDMGFNEINKQTLHTTAKVYF
jgi:Leucine-rich repeat (LRR) protein